MSTDDRVDNEACAEVYDHARRHAVGSGGARAIAVERQASLDPQALQAPTFQ
jgi:hypothetical protein